MKVSFIHALDQPLNKQRLASELVAALNGGQFNSLHIVVAAVSLAALIRLDASFAAWKKSGKKVVAIYGVDIGATSNEALQYSMSMFSEVYVARIAGVRFHPKMYVFSGPKAGLVFYGSNNLTVPGTELNLEACVRIAYDFPADDQLFSEQMRGIEELLAEQKSSTVFRLTAALTTILAKEGLTVPEARLGKTDYSTGGTASTKSKLPKSSLKKVPPSAVPRRVLSSGAKPGKKASGKGSLFSATKISAIGALVMQIKPHHNGEIFLSKIAVDQNPRFFGWPFKGKTVPKRAGNPGYPQRVPDPVVDIEVFGNAGKSVFSLANYPLNTVYYSKKHEVRVTCAQLVSHVPDYSIMIMREVVSGGSSKLDYDIEIHRPDSPMYAAWLHACNQLLPGGGKKPRGFGWI